MQLPKTLYARKGICTSFDLATQQRSNPSLIVVHLRTATIAALLWHGASITQHPQALLHYFTAHWSQDLIESSHPPRSTPLVTPHPLLRLSLILLRIPTPISRWRSSHFSHSRFTRPCSRFATPRSISNTVDSQLSKRVFIHVGELLRHVSQNCAAGITLLVHCRAFRIERCKIPGHAAICEDV